MENSERFKKVSKIYSKERNLKISKSLTGRKLSEEHNKKLHDRVYKKGKESRIFGRKASIETRKKQSEAHKGITFTEEHIKKMLTRNEKSSLEIKYEELFKKLDMPYKFVGNGEVLIAKKCPDFINSNGEKIAIEVFYRKHKEMFRGGLDQWKADRIKIFNENGWQVYFLDETQLNEECLSNFRNERRNLL